MTAFFALFFFFFLNHGAVSHICHNHNFSNMCSFRNSLKRAAFDLLRWEFCLAGFRSLFRGLWIPPDCYVPFCSLLDSLPPHYLFGALKDAPKSMFVLVGIYIYIYILFFTLVSTFFLFLFLPVLLWSFPGNKLLKIFSLINAIVVVVVFAQLLTLQPWSAFLCDRTLPVNNLKEVKKDSLCHRQKWNWYVWFESFREVKSCYS